jgi:hypothetical protein
MPGSTPLRLLPLHSTVTPAAVSLKFSATAAVVASAAVPVWIVGQLG